MQSPQFRGHVQISRQQEEYYFINPSILEVNLARKWFGNGKKWFRTKEQQ